MGYEELADVVLFLWGLNTIRRRFDNQLMVNEVAVVLAKGRELSRARETREATPSAGRQELGHIGLGNLVWASSITVVLFEPDEELKHIGMIGFAGQLAAVLPLQ